ncbi:hypothetical protein THAOC_34289 [Thalassiosira oceanica]|uniref:Uncharacterized protein n=1 Tax=Thalassiosira oceanica TaxID=159749 RepID=K0RJY8_THAOC|nr:hypothetical protein THAOC_34289 [Thalassiosira oceanica]|eukprot:EJK47017.1 hypothetical protein THAOC_34289 [Thalassiosira oceanica]
MESYPCGAQISTINRRRLVVAGVNSTGDMTPLAFRQLSATMEPTIGPLSHHHGGKGKTAETYARRAQEICAVRDPRQMQGAALSTVNNTVNKVVPPVNELVHVVGRGDAQRGAYRREGDGAHRRGGRGRGSLCASSLLPSHDRDEEVNLPDPVRGR